MNPLTPFLILVLAFSVFAIIWLVVREVRKHTFLPPSKGCFKISVDTINGEDVKVIECITSGTLDVESMFGLAWQSNWPNRRVVLRGKKRLQSLRSKSFENMLLRKGF